MILTEIGLRDWHNQTTIHPIGLAVVLVLAAAMLQLPRRHAVVPLLLMACFVPVSQRLVVAGLDFHFVRLLVLAGWMRILLRRELAQFRWKPLDGLVLLWIGTSCMVFSLHTLSLDACINRLGHAFDGIGIYVLVRLFVRDARDVQTVARSLAMIAVPVAMAFMVERMTGRNFFSILGGVPDYTIEREGKLRCQGAFAHPILAGSFWATAAPLLCMLLLQPRGRDRWLAMAGFASAVTVILLCASSTPIGALGVALGTMAAFLARAYLAWFKWIIAIAVVGLQLAMIQPIWHLLARVSFVPGSTSYYRFKLFDEFIAHVDEWWLSGARNLEHWWGYANGDITNQYVLEGVHGGLIGLGLFVLLIATALRAAGLRCRVDRARVQHCIVPWSLGCSLHTHCAVFWGVSYFGQIEMAWYLTLGMIASLSTAPGTVIVRLRAVRITRSTPARHPLASPLQPAFS